MEYIEGLQMEEKSLKKLRAQYKKMFGVRFKPEATVWDGVPRFGCYGTLRLKDGSIQSAVMLTDEEFQILKAYHDRGMKKIKALADTKTPTQ